MKVAVAVTFYRDEEIPMVEALRSEVKRVNPNWSFFCTDKRSCNKGFPSNVNEAIKEAVKKEKPDVIMVCNPDVRLGKVSEETLIKGGNHFDVWGFPFTQNKKIYYRGIVDPWRMSGGLDEYKPSSDLYQVDFVSGSLFFVKSKVFHTIGLLPEYYFIYYDDVEFCWKAKQAGFRVGVDSRYTYTHLEKSDSVNPLKKYLLCRNRLIFFWKYSTPKQKMREILYLPQVISEFIFQYVRKMFVKKI